MKFQKANKLILVFLGIIISIYSLKCVSDNVSKENENNKDASNPNTSVYSTCHSDTSCSYTLSQLDTTFCNFYSTTLLYFCQCTSTSSAPCTGNCPNGGRYAEINGADSTRARDEMDSTTTFLKCIKTLTYRESNEKIQLQFFQSEIIGAQSGLMFWAHVDTTGYGSFGLLADSISPGKNFIKVTKGIKSRENDLAELKRMETDALSLDQFLGDLEIYFYSKNH